MNNPEKDRVCAVTVTYGDRFKYLKNVIEFCLKGNVSKIIIVDNASVENSRKQLRKIEEKYKDKIKVIYLNENLGSAGGYKKGLEEAYKCEECDYILLLDDDNVLQQGGVRKYLEILKELSKSNDRDDVALFALRSSRPYLIEIIKSGTSENLLEPLNSFLGFHIFHYWKRIVRKILKKIKASNGLEFKKRKYIKTQYALFGGLFFNKKILEKVGFPDEKYYLYGDDIDFTYRMVKNGIEVYLIPNLKIIDLDEYWAKPEESKKHSYFFGNVNRVFYTIRNQIYFQMKYRVTNRFIFNINKYIYNFKMFISALFNKKLDRFHLYRRAVQDAIHKNMGKRKYRVLFISNTLDESKYLENLLNLVLKECNSNHVKDITTRKIILEPNNLKREDSCTVNNSLVILNTKNYSNKFLNLLKKIVGIPKVIYYIWKINPDLILISKSINNIFIVISKLLGYKTYIFDCKPDNKHKETIKKVVRDIGNL